MKRKNKITVLMGLGLVAWMALGATAAFFVDDGGQLGWLILSFMLLGFNAGLVLLEFRAARAASEIQIEAAQATVEAWPHVITLLEDLERIEPERAEMIQVVRLEMVDVLERERRTAAGRAPTWRELVSRKKPKS